jgi:hypothetical protein
MENRGEKGCKAYGRRIGGGLQTAQTRWEGGKLSVFGASTHFSAQGDEITSQQS